jgi:mRNA-degrading endonuclease RelE of RelBE toxin-antitoxin system
MYKVTLAKKAKKNMKLLPPVVAKKFALLLMELKKLGPVRAKWQNYSKLGVNKHHCHLNYNWVACWEETETGV